MERRIGRGFSSRINMATLSRNMNSNAGASPGDDARHHRPNDARSGKGLSGPGRTGLKQLVPHHHHQQQQQQQQQHQRQRQQQQQHLRLATINVGSLTGRGRELADMLKRRRVDIACIQETKWKGGKARDIGDGYKLYFNGTTNTRNGIGVIISEEFRDYVTEVIRVSDRLMSIKISTGLRTLRVVSCYAPQTGCPDADKDAFWLSVDVHIRSFAANEHLILGGDLNGHVGNARDGYDRFHGGNGFGCRNNEGDRILACAEAHDLIVANTFFKKRTSHLVTYTSGGHSTQIDYWLLRREDKKIVLDTKVIPSEIVATQHRLLVIDLRLRLSLRPRPRMNGPEKIKWWHLRQKKPQLIAALGTVTTDLDDSVEAQWNGLTNKIRTVAAGTLGKTKPGRRFIDKEVWWWNDEVQDATKAKKVAFQQWRKSHEASDWQEYRQLKSSAKRAVAAAKAAYYADVYEKLKTPEGAVRIYQLANSRHRASQDTDQVTNIRGADHQILQDPIAIRRRWREYFDEISNDEFRHQPIPHTDPVLGPVAPITPTEVTKALEKMKNGKATGPDDIPAEAWKLLGRRGAEILASLFNEITKNGTAPPMWTTSITVPIWKNKGDVSDCKNYRPIRLLCHAMKIFERIIDARLREIVDISTNQCGFVKGTGTTDAIHAARLLIERHREKNRKIHVAFLDLEKAFDRVPRDLIWASLRSHGVPEEYVRWIKTLYAHTTSVVRCPAGTSEPFPITVGVHQGSALSPLLFILCMDTVTADLQTSHPWTLLYADDVLIASATRHQLEGLVNEWNLRLDRHGLRLNLEKTVYMETGEQTDGTVSVNGQQLKKVTEFKYLGSILRSDGDSYPDVRARVNAAWIKWRQVTGVLCDRRMPTTIKGKVYKTVVRPVALYGSECWAATTKHEQALHVMEMKMLRWPLGLTRLDHVMNVDVRRRLGVAPIPNKMRESRLRWFGHVVRSSEGTVAKTAFHLSPPGRRSRGRPKKRWMDCVKEDMRVFHLTPEDAQDRVKWKKASRTADPVTARD